MKLKHAATFTAGGTPAVDNSDMWSDDGTPWVSIGDMSRSDHVSSTHRRISPAGIADRRLRIGPPGTVLFAMYASVGAVATLAVAATWNQALVGLTPITGRSDGRFLAYWLRHARSALLAEVRTATQPNLNAEQVANLRIPDTALQDQRRIADYLDAQVSRIDRIIAARRAQIALTRTRLLSSWTDATFIATADVRLVPLRRFTTSIVDGPFGSSLTSAHYRDTGTRVIRLGNIGLGDFRPDDAVYIDNAHAATLGAHAVAPGDVIMAGLGDDTWPLGRATVAPHDLGPAIVKADCYRVRLVPGVDPTFVALFLSSPPCGARLRLLSRGATRSRLNTEVAVEAPIAATTPPRQAEFVERVRRAQRDWVTTTAALTRSIELLTEYKQSLITAAVTGEIDVSTASDRGVPA